MSEPIRILFHVDTLCVGGLENLVTELALNLDRTRFEPVVSYSMEGGVNARRLEQAGISVIRVVPHGPKQRGVGLAVGQIRKVNPAIFHTFSCRRNMYDVQVARRAGVPVIISARVNVRHWAPPGPARNWEFDRNARTNWVTANCEAAARLCRDVEGFRQENIAVIYNGVGLPSAMTGPTVREELGLPESAAVAGYAARYRSLKAHETLLKAWRKVVDRHADAHLICCGEDCEVPREHLRDVAARLGIAANVTLLGPRDPGAPMDAFYRGLNVYVHASRSEGFSMATLEAMNLGLPVVATNVGGTPELVEDGVTGLLVPASDPGALASAIRELFADRVRAAKMGAAGLERVRDRFSISTMVRGYQAVYSRVVPQVDAISGGGRVYEVPGTEFTGISDARLLSDTTVFVTTIGDTRNFEDCLAHLRAQTVRCRVEVIDRVAPMSAAFAMMHERCNTAFYVQVDEDMLLYPDTLEKLHDSIAGSPAEVAMVCGALWDRDVERAIQGIKIYRHEIVRQFPYQDSISCEMDQLARMQKAGFQVILASIEPGAVCMGDHGVHYTPETIFRRWQRLFHKRNQLNHLVWLEPWPERLLERYLTTREPLHFYALLGALAGISGRADPHRELDWRQSDPAWVRIRHYFPPNSRGGEESDT